MTVGGEVLVLDEFGCEPFNSEATAHLFRLVSARHGHGSIILTANTGFSQWKNLFPSETQTIATVDRLVDRATILRFTGKTKRSPLGISGARCAAHQKPTTFAQEKSTTAAGPFVPCRLLARSDSIQ